MSSTAIFMTGLNNQNCWKVYANFAYNISICCLIVRLKCAFKVRLDEQVKNSLALCDKICQDWFVQDAPFD